MRKYSLALLLFISLAGCNQQLPFTDDLEQAQIAYEERNLGLCERLVERYLKEEEDPDKRWQAWELLLKAINARGSEPRASLECLEAMRIEFEEDESRLSAILTRMGRYNENMRQHGRAAEAWSAFVELADITDMDRLQGLRRLARAQFYQRHFDAAEETLQQCLALPVSEKDRLYCMLDLADQNMARANWTGVIDQCQQILELGPDSQLAGMAGYLLADALEQERRYDEALAQFEESRALYPNPAVMNNRIAALKKIISEKK